MGRPKSPYPRGQHPNSQAALKQNREAPPEGNDRNLQHGLYSEHPEKLVTPNGVVFAQTNEFLQAALTDGAVLETRFQGTAMRWKAAYHQWLHASELASQGKLTTGQLIRLDKLADRLLQMEREMGLTPASAADVGLKAAQEASEREKLIKEKRIVPLEERLTKAVELFHRLVEMGVIRRVPVEPVTQDALDAAQREPEAAELEYERVPDQGAEVHSIFDQTFRP